MFAVIFSCVFLFAAAIAILIGALKAKKRAWQLSVTRIVLSLVSALLAAVASSLTAYYGIGALLNMFLTPELLQMMSDIPSAQTIIVSIAAMIVSPLLFLLFYLIIRLIAMAFTKLITRGFIKITTKKSRAPEADPADPEPAAEPADAGSEYYKKLFGDDTPVAVSAKKPKEFALEKNSWVSALCGGLCALFTLCIMLTPMVGTLDVVDDVAALPLRSAAKTDDSGVLTMVVDVLDAAANNAGRVTVKIFGGGLMYDAMTTYNVDGELASLRKETGAIRAIANAVVLSTDAEADKTEAAQSVRDIGKAFKKSTILPKLCSELTASAAGDWREGKDFYGIAMPSFGEAIDPLMMSLVEAFAKSDTKTIKEDVATFADITAALVEKDAFTSFSKDPLAVFADEETMSAVLVELLENPRLCVLVDGFSDFGISVLMNTVNVPERLEPLYEKLLSEANSVYSDSEEGMKRVYADLFDNYGLEVSEENIAAVAQARANGEDAGAWIAANVIKSEAEFVSMTQVIPVRKITDGIPEIVDKEKEARAIAHSFNTIYKLIGDTADSALDAKLLLKDLGPVLDAFATTESIGAEKTGYILKALLQSKMVHDKIGLSALEASDTAESISKNSVDGGGYEAMLNSLAKVVDIMEAANDPTKDTQTAVKQMLEDLTPQTAEVMQTVSTPKVVKNYGVPDQASGPIANMFSDTFGNLSTAKEAGMTDEEYEKEAAAVADMTNVLMSTGTGGQMFGEGGRTGGSAEQFVDNILNSKVMSQTLIDTVYEGGDEPKHDPLVSDRKMSQAERDALTASIDAKWQSSDKSEQSKKELISIAAIMNVKINITENGVEQVVEPTTPEVTPDSTTPDNTTPDNEQVQQ